ncbi:thioester domain-containing protein [Leucobacter iarius]|uniref:Thioester domain-containing protein n=1 Tax=Leucobacter iarius TaxID=333963 RepID=A0ABN2LPP4_9MICO
MARGTLSSPARGKRRWAVALLAAAALLAPALASPAAAEADPAAAANTPVWVGGKQGYGGTGVFPIYSSTPEDPANPGDPDFWAYCIEHDVHAKTRTPAIIGDAASYLGSNHFSDPVVRGRVLWVLAHGYPALSLADFGAAAGTPGISRNDAIEAMQYAIWRYTDLDFDADWAWESEDSKNAYWYLVNGANASAGVTPADFAGTVSVTGPTGSAKPGELVGPFTVHTDRAPAQVTVDPALALTDAAGNAIDANAVTDGQQIYLDLRASTTSGSATLTASIAGSGFTGSVISVPNTADGTPNSEDHAQSLVLVAGSGTRTSASATAQWIASSTPTTTPGPTTTPTPTVPTTPTTPATPTPSTGPTPSQPTTPTAGGTTAPKPVASGSDDLAVTGALIPPALIAGLGLFAVLGGGALLLALRRRADA